MCPTRCRLDGVSSLLPNPELFLYAYVRREALLSSQIEGLVDLGIAREITGGRLNRLFAYDAYLAILSEGTEPL